MGSLSTQDWFKLTDDIQAILVDHAEMSQDHAKDFLSCMHKRFSPPSFLQETASIGLLLTAIAGAGLFFCSSYSDHPVYRFLCDCVVLSAVLSLLISAAFQLGTHRNERKIRKFFRDFPRLDRALAFYQDLLAIQQSRLESDA